MLNDNGENQRKWIKWGALMTILNTFHTELNLMAFHIRIHTHFANENLLCQENKCFYYLIGN